MIASATLIEAQAFSYATFGFLATVNNLWTCLAVVAAAVSFWRIRSVSSIVKSDIPSESTASSQANTFSPPPSTPSQPPITAVMSLSEFNDGVTKRKFSLYYRDDDEEEKEKERNYGEVTVVKEWDGEWWDLYRKSVAINGKVVRIWDDCNYRVEVYDGAFGSRCYGFKTCYG